MVEGDGVAPGAPTAVGSSDYTIQASPLGTAATLRDSPVSASVPNKTRCPIGFELWADYF